MIDRFSHAVALKMKEHYGEAPVEIIRYSLNSIINPLITILLTGLIAWQLDVFYESICALFAFGILRAFSGGHHLDSSELCIAVSTTLFIGIGIMTSILVFNKSTLFIIAALSLALIITFAPSKIEGQTKIPERFYSLLRIISVVIVIIGYFSDYAPIILSLFIQSLLTIFLRKEVK